MAKKKKSFILYKAYCNSCPFVTVSTIDLNLFKVIMQDHLRRSHYENAKYAQKTEHTQHLKTRHAVGLAPYTSSSLEAPPLNDFRELFRIDATSFASLAELMQAFKHQHTVEQDPSYWQALHRAMSPKDLADRLSVLQHYDIRCLV